MEKLPNFITQQEFEKMFDEVIRREKKATPKGKKRLMKYRLAMLLAFEAGMRVSEIAGLKEEISRCCNAKLDIKRGKTTGRKHYICTACGKDCLNKSQRRRDDNGEWGIKPLSKEQIDLQAHTIRINSGKGKKDRVVSLPKRISEKALNLLPLTIGRRQLQRFVSQLGKDVLGKDISIHSFRHGCFTHLAGKGVPLHMIQLLAGHARLDTTSIYLHANPAEAIEKSREVF